MTLTLLFREYCSLCHRMRADLQPYQARYGFELAVLDVDDDPELETRYNELVPVLLHGDTEICHWHLDEAALQRFLQQQGLPER
ncbi:glutaredoxin family protein [Neisseria shayeganii]|uniref:Glutaredoxin 2 n=1 Tax=Neisseria shayeganii 871 TaxID=1032488 RepID=G4CK76_9NEIS|nr:glutaredoxin family protein [Neisseria shayeganii]EGY51803.1 glutaredoxin 2 [Neisseria shayeganii 871]